jgi:hypothetical protein
VPKKTAVRHSVRDFRVFYCISLRLRRADGAAINRTHAGRKNFARAASWQHRIDVL